MERTQDAESARGERALDGPRSPARVLMVLSGMLPSPRGTCGVPVITWSMLHTLLQRGHTVGVCAFSGSPVERGRAEARDRLQARGVEVFELGDGYDRDAFVGSGHIRRKAHVARRIVAPATADVFPGVRYSSSIEQTLQKFAPDAVYAFDFNPVVALSELEIDAVTLAAIGNLDHEAREVRRAAFPPQNRLGRTRHAVQRISERTMGDVEMRALARFDRVICHAAHHARWLEDRGVPCRYVPGPVVDAVGREWLQRRRELAVGKTVPEILFIGRINSTINTPALELLAFDILPILEDRLGDNGFMLNIVGQGDIQPKVEARLDRPWVRRRGFVESVAPEFLRSDVLLVPTPSRLGFRTRVIEGFSYGCCVVSHEANSWGMPDLVHGKNVLLGGNGKMLAEAIIEAIRDPALAARLGKEGRDLFERRHDAASVCADLTREIEESVSGRRRR